LFRNCVVECDMESLVTTDDGSAGYRGFDKRFCFDEKSLNQRIECVNRHAPD